jgi:hypothetical protein
VRDPKDLFALCPENEEVQEICKVPEFQRQYLQKNKETVTKYLEKHNFPSNWTNSIMLEGLAALEVTIGLLSMEQNFAALGEALTKFKDKITESDLNSFCLAYGMRHCELMSLFLGVYLTKFQSSYSKKLDVLVRTAVATRRIDIVKLLLASRHFDLKCDEEETYSLSTLTDQNLDILVCFDLKKFNTDVVQKLAVMYLRKSQLMLFKHVTNKFPNAEMRNYVTSNITSWRIVLHKEMMPYLHTFLGSSEAYWRSCFLSFQIDFSWFLSISKEPATIRNLFSYLQVYSDPNVKEKYQELFAHLDNHRYTDVQFISGFITSIPDDIAQTLINSNTFARYATNARLFLLRNLTNNNQ